MNYNFSDRAKNLQGNAIREIFKVLQDPQMISFAGGFPSADCLAADVVDSAAHKILSGKEATAVLQYGGTEGYMPFRRTGVEYLKRVGLNNFGIDNVLAISGGQQGIDLMCKAFLNKGDCILVEDPTYLAVLHILKTYEAKAYGIDSGDDGIDPDDLERKIEKYSPKFVYLVPNFSNPTGRTIPVENRERIAEICGRRGVILLEDDPYRELRYDGQPLPSISSFDKNGACVYVTSFSKTVSPGLRVGLLAGPEEIVRKLTVCKQAVDVHTSSLSQAIINELIISGSLFDGVAKSVPKYRAKRDAMIAALEEYMPSNFCFSRPQGGLFIWGEFSDGTSAKANFKAALDRKVAYVCGNDFFADGRGDNTLRLNFSGSTAENIVTGVKRLSELFRGV